MALSIPKLGLGNESLTRNRNYLCVSAVRYFQMKKIKKGCYLFYQDKEKIASETTDGFYISKFEVSNEQFAAFINDDGYEMKKYWLIKRV